MCSYFFFFWLVGCRCRTFTNSYRPFKFSQLIHTEYWFYVFSFGDELCQNLWNCLLSASTVISPVNFTSFISTSWYTLVIGDIFKIFNVPLSVGIIVIGDPVYTMNSFSIPSIFLSRPYEFCGRLFALFRLLYLST